MTSQELDRGDMRASKRRAWIGAGFLLAALAGALLLFALPPSVGPFPGNRAPAFDLVDLEGNAVASAQLSGKPIFINFWATWCVPCRYELPAIQELYEARGDSFTMIAVSDEPLDAVRRYVDAAGYTFPIYVDPDRSMNQAFRIRGYPTSVFIDGEGIIRTVHLGQLSRADMERYLDQIAGSKGAAPASP